MLGLNLLLRLGRSVLKGPVTEAGLLPAKVYRHLILEAMADEDFPVALDYLKWAADPLLAQILVLRLRLLAGEHRRRLGALQDLLGTDPAPGRLEACQALLSQESRALELLAEYEARALVLAAAGDRGLSSAGRI